MVVLGIAVFFIAIGATANAVMDKLSFHYGNSVFPQGDKKLFGKGVQWWQPSKSWLNKYKDFPFDTRARFIGAKTWAVWITDAWHFFKMIMISSFQVAIALSVTTINQWPWWTSILCLAVMKFTFGSVFTLFFDMLLKKK